MNTVLSLFLAFATVSGVGDSDSLVGLGGDPSRGTLVAHAQDGVHFDPARPTLIFVHGLNPFPQSFHFTMTERLAESVAQRPGARFNVLGWNWNAESYFAPHGVNNEQRAVQQGHLLASAIHHLGVPPSRIHFIGQSSGCIVVASAARTLSAWHGGESVAQMTFLDPAESYHNLVFDHFAAASLARRVENFWCPGPSGYGRQVDRLGIWNTRVAGPNPYLGTVLVARSSHWQVVEWYFRTVADPGAVGGFNSSVLLAANR